MDDQKDKDCLEIPVKIPLPWMQRFAGHLITIAVMGVMTVSSAWFTQTIVTQHQVHTTTAITSNQSQLDELREELRSARDQIDDLKQLNADCKHDLKELKRILGVTTKGDDVTVWNYKHR